jgi:hypothetical protein
VHVAEVLRQVENSGVPVGGWAGGDAWFGSVCASVTLKQQKDVESTWIIKNNLALFPQRPLKAILDARYPERKAGHWVVMTTELCDVPLIAIAYAWSNSSVAYFLSTVGDTCPAAKFYETKFEDEYGEKQEKQVPRPEICDFIYDFLPLIDNHNKARQHHLALEKKWLTEDCWFRLFSTLIGFSVVDLYRLYRYDDEFKWKDVSIIKFSDMLCGDGLKLRERHTLPVPLRKEAQRGSVKRIRNVNGEETKTITKKQKKGTFARQNTGSAIQASCFMCRKYTPKIKYTSFCCSCCGTPICQPLKDYIPGDREGWTSCVQEHLNSGNEKVRCDRHIKKTFPKELKVHSSDDLSESTTE